ncbi:MAG TPA: endo-1,4-beta-xylanase [Fibrobacteraceae bacterium]|nr:endo-1,4-beta-xylanase [Fibrobacteraceae bacterium]
MRLNFIVLGISLVLSGFQMIQAATDSTLRELAEARGRYVGSILNSEWFNSSVISGYEDLHNAQFNVVVAENEMKFYAMEPSQNSFSYTSADKLLSYAETNNMRVRGHCLVWHSQLPSWISSGSWTRSTLLAVMKNHIQTVVSHYKGRIQEWDVVNEAIDDNSTHDWRVSVWDSVIGDDYIDSAFVWAHEADPDAELYYNDYGIEWGVGSGTKAGFLLSAIKTWISNGIPISGVGTQTHIKNTYTGTPSNVKALADTLAKLGLKLAITELDIGFTKGTTPSASDLAAQGSLYGEFMDVFLNATNMSTFVMWGFTDRYSWLPTSMSEDYGLIYDSSLTEKPAYDSLVAALQRHSSVVNSSAFSSSVTSSSSKNSSSSKGSSSNALVSSSSEDKSPYSSAAVLPGIVQIENYDLGGQNVAYYDSDDENQGGLYRSDAVDIGTDSATGDYVVAWTAAGEWLEYTVQVEESGPMVLTAHVASNQSTGIFKLQLDGNDVTGSISIPSTESWNTYTDIVDTTSSLSAGEHVLRLSIEAASFNIDWLKFENLTSEVKMPYRISPNLLELHRVDLLGRKVQ